MTAIALLLVAAPIVLFGYAYFAYPAILKAVAALRPVLPQGEPPREWPFISITVPAYNEEASIRATLENLLSADYPADRRQIVVISDASTDRTHEIVAEFAGRGVELLRLPQRRGKTVAENAAAAVVRGDLVINMDASVRILPHSLKALVRAFEDPAVGVASGRDLSIGAVAVEGNQGESGYVGYEMWVRALESKLDSIVGVSGCFYGIRRELYDARFPEHLSRDFASALVAKERGFRAVSVDEAVCLVPRTSSLRSEFRRKIRTMARGLATLWYKRHLMHPFRYRGFALMLISHKLCRWLFYLALPGALVGLVVLALHSRAAALLLAAVVIGTMLGVVGLRWPTGQRVPPVFALPGFILASNLAGVLAWVKALRRE
ncbi:MAG: glycosyltransferase, partial [Chloroflexota bacterium]|nr:glycosyltransferase [Chloroflexota bacterium]